MAAESLLGVVAHRMPSALATDAGRGFFFAEVFAAMPRAQAAIPALQALRRTDH